MATNQILRLTDAVNGASAFALFSTPVNATGGLIIKFDFYSYGGTGGDGFSFFLLDGANTPTTAGGFGGSLGYAGRVDGTVPTPGIVGGYVGIGFDEFGNYSNDNEGRLGRAPSTIQAQPDGTVPDSIAIRGSAAGGYAYLTGTGTLRPADAPTGLDNPGVTDLNLAKRTAQITLTPAGLFNVQIDFNADGDFSDPLETNPELQNLNIAALNGNVPIPSTFTFGFGAATGDSTNIHEVGNFTVTTFDGTPIAGSLGSIRLVGRDLPGGDTITGDRGGNTIVGGTGGDTQTGRGGADRFVFSGATKAEALRSSRLRNLDRITDFRFRENDKFVLDFDNNLATTSLPRRLFNAGAESPGLRRAARSAYADKNQVRPGNQALRPNEAVFFTMGSRTFLSVNDDNVGFNPRADLLAEVTGIQFKAGDNRRGKLQVTDYFA
ncbi:MAG: hypothetical protein MUF49_04565 [Oculatellaceae cyanobacterium Prado106]|jgi:hypothetical protein|nr:hypothetical protein [Oculatellaceae cyanobacterium Prado106]